MSDYETHIRSNESVRDNIDGKLNEPLKPQVGSMEENDKNKSKEDHTQSIG